MRKLPLRLRLPLLVIAFAVLPAVVIAFFLSSTGQRAVRTVTQGLLDTGRRVIESSTGELTKLSEGLLNQTSEELINTGQQGVERVGRDLADIGQKAIRQSAQQVGEAANQSVQNVTASIINTMNLNLEVMLGGLISSTKDALKEATRTAVANRADKLALQAGELVSNQLDTLALTAQVADLKTLDPARAKLTLMALQARKGFLRLALLDGGGQPVAAYGFSLRENFASRPEFSVPFSQAQQYVSPVMQEKGRVTAFIRTAVPVFLYGKRAVGVLVGDVSLQPLANLVAREKTSGYAFLVDERGRAIAHTDRQAAARRADLSGLEPVKDGLAGKGGATEFADGAWGTMVAGYAPVAGRRWVVVVAEKAVVAYRAVSRMEASMKQSLNETTHEIRLMADDWTRKTQEALAEPVERSVQQASAAMARRSGDLTAQIVEEMRQKSRQSLAGTLATMAPKAQEASTQATSTMLPQAERQLAKTTRQFTTIGATVLIVCALLAAVLSLFFLRGIIRPIRQLVTGAKTVAEGDLRQQLALESGDELGELSDAFTQMKENLQDLIGGIKTASTRIVELADSLSQASAEVGQSSEYVARAMNDLSAGASAGADSVNRTVQEAQSVSAQVTQTLTAARQAGEAAAASDQAVATGREALDGLVARMNAIAAQGEQSLARMSNLRQSSGEIGQITEIISSIAEQTNLLALNAAIEAARAGEHGRGFAVVAEEVRKLAEQSQQAVKRISGLIESIQGETDRMVAALEGDAAEIRSGVQAVEGVRGAFGSISEAAAAIDTSVQGIVTTAATLEQSSRVMAEAMQEISSVTQETAASAEEVGANAQEQAAAVQQINRLAQDLTGLARHLLERVEQFKLVETGEALAGASLAPGGKGGQA